MTPEAHGSPRTDERGAQLSALLDGELGPEEEAEVRAWLERTPEAQAELAALAEVRSQVRGLPAVDPPFGFYERLLREQRRSRPRGLGLVATAAAVVVALVLVVGVTPPAEAMVPPVDRYAARHEAMASTSTPASAPTGGAAAGSTTSAVAPASTPAGSSAAAVAGYERVDAAALPVEDARAPASLGPSLTRKAAWRGPGGVLHVVYSGGPTMVSLYEEPGMVSWDRLPDAGRRLQLAEAPAWWMRSGPTEIVVVEKQGTVYTVVAAAPHDEVVAMAAALPAPAELTLAERLRRAAEDCSRRFGFGA